MKKIKQVLTGIMLLSTFSSTFAGNDGGNDPKPLTDKEVQAAFEHALNNYHRGTSSDGSDPDEIIKSSIMGISSDYPW